MEYFLDQKLVHKKILEIGAGAGIISYNLIKLGNNVLSIDIDMELFRNTVFPGKGIQFFMAYCIAMLFKGETLCNHLQFNIYLLDYYQLINLLSAKFDVFLDLTPMGIKKPDQFSLRNEIPIKVQDLLKKFPLSILRLFSPFYPSWIIIVKKL